jgi:hypothetical protein
MQQKRKPLQPKKTQQQTVSVSGKHEGPVEDLIEYPELSDSELEVVCGGGNLISKH